MEILAVLLPPPNTLTSTTAVTAAPTAATTMIATAVPEIPPPAPAARRAFVCEIVVAAVRPPKEAVTLVLNLPATPFGFIVAAARPALSEVTVSVCAPCAKVPLGPLLGSVKITQGAGDGLIVPIAHLHNFFAGGPFFDVVRKSVTGDDCDFQVV